MRKIGALILSMMILFSGCGNKEKNIETLDVSDPDNFMDCLAEIISEKDSDRLYNFFSEETQQYDLKLFEETQEFVDCFKGDYVSYSLLYSESSEHTRPDEDAKYKESILAAYEVNTTEGNYKVCFIYYNETPRRTYIGLQTLGVQILDESETETFMCSDIHGCYVVTPDNHDELIARRDYDIEHSNW